jgi:predicted amidohydrolase YtcJ
VKADLILLGRVFTADRGCPRAEAVAVANESIIAVGNEADVLRLRGRRTEVVGDARSAIIPGFVDAHLHLVALARRATEVDCSASTAASVGEIAAAIRRATVERSPGTWIRAFGYDEFFLAEKRPPTVAELDEAAPHHPVRLLHRTGHAAVLNTRALERIGLAPREVIYEPAAILKDRVPALGAGETAELVRRRSRELFAAGITTIHDPTPGQGPAEISALEGWTNDGTIGQRVVVYGALDGFGGEAESVSPRFRRAGVKVVVEERSEADAIAEEVAAADRAGARVALHAVEGGPLVVAVEALRRLGRERVRTRRHRLEHASFAPPALCDDIARSGATVSTHPVFLSRFGEKYASELSADERGWLYPLKTLLDAGVPVALGSDAPIAPPRPLANVEAAVRRRTERGRVIGPSQAVGVADALSLHTLGGAAAAGLETIVGSIAPGMLADLVVLEADPTEVAPHDIASIDVRMTLVGGKVVWRPSTGSG